MAVVPATRRSVAAPQPQRTPATRERRPQLRVVDRPVRRPVNVAVVTVLVVGGIFVLLFGLVVFHTMLLQNQQRLDQLDAEVTDAQARYQSLRLQVAKLESPQRILEVATQKLGMVPSDGTTYLTPTADEPVDGSSGANQDRTAGAERAAPSSDGASSWPEVKPYLGAAP